MQLQRQILRTNALVKDAMALELVKSAVQPVLSAKRAMYSLESAKQRPMLP